MTQEPKITAETPWIQTYGKNPQEKLGAIQFDLGWKSGKVDAFSRRRCPFPTGSISAAAWRAAKAFHKELGI